LCGPLTLSSLVFSRLSPFHNRRCHNGSEQHEYRAEKPSYLCCGAHHGAIQYGIVGVMRRNLNDTTEAAMTNQATRAETRSLSTNKPLRDEMTTGQLEMAIGGSTGVNPTTYIVFPFKTVFVNRISWTND
jgi:hypothetical protein